MAVVTKNQHFYIDSSMLRLVDQGKIFDDQLIELRYQEGVLREHVLPESLMCGEMNVILHKKSINPILVNASVRTLNSMAHAWKVKMGKIAERPTRLTVPFLWDSKCNVTTHLGLLLIEELGSVARKISYMETKYGMKFIFHIRGKLFIETLLECPENKLLGSN